MVRVEERVARVEGQVNELSERLSGVEAAIRHFEQRFDQLDAKVSNQFVWIVGIQITTIVAIVAALISTGRP